MNCKLELTDEQVDTLLDLVGEKMTEESERLESKLSPDKFTRTPEGLHCDMTGLNTEYYQKLYDLQTLLYGICLD